MEYDLKECPVCGEDHAGLKFKKLTKPIGAANVAAQCPKEKVSVLATLSIVPVQMTAAAPAPQ